MKRNVFLQNSIIQSRYKNQAEDHKHSCPFCRCKSMDNSINIKIHAKTACQFNILLGKDFLQKKNKYSKNDINNQHVYYRNFGSPKRRGLSPNGSKKIIIQYVSPSHNQQNSNFFKPLFKLAQQKNMTNSIKLNSPFNHAQPRNIYTNQNTPPKARFLQQRSSRKNSQDKIRPQFTFALNNPVQGLALYQSQRIKSPCFINSPKSSYPTNNNIIFTNNQNQTPNVQNQNQNGKKKLKDIEISPINRISNISQIPYTQTKNLIQRISSPRSSSSPFNSLTQSTPKVIPYGNFESTPLINEYSASKRILDLKPINQFTQNQRYEPKKYSSQSYTPQIISNQKPAPKPQQSIKLIQSPQKSQKNINNDINLQKTLGKPKLIARVYEFDRKYSQSNRNSINNISPSSLQNIPNYNVKFNNESQLGQKNNHQNDNENNKRIQSQRNVFQKKRINFNTIQISDNFKTPKSKYKKSDIADSIKLKQPLESLENHSNNSNNNICFNPIRLINNNKVPINTSKSQQLIHLHQTFSGISNAGPTVFSQSVSGSGLNIHQLSKINQKQPNQNNSPIVLKPNKPKQLFSLSSQSNNSHYIADRNTLQQKISLIQLQNEQKLHVKTSKNQNSSQSLKKQKQEQNDDNSQQQIVTLLQQQLKLNYDYFRYYVPQSLPTANQRRGEKNGSMNIHSDKKMSSDDYYSYNIIQNAQVNKNQLNAGYLNKNNNVEIQSSSEEVDITF